VECQKALGRHDEMAVFDTGACGTESALLVALRGRRGPGGAQVAPGGAQVERVTGQKYEGLIEVGRISLYDVISKLHVRLKPI
jgi:hypothetical protein